MSIANLWKRKDAKLRALDVITLWQPVAENQSDSKKNCRFCLLFYIAEKLAIFFAIKKMFLKVLQVHVKKASKVVLEKRYLNHYK